MKKFLVILLGFTFVFQAAVTSVVFINWKINQERITELYCVNRDNPIMHCEGKCYLSLQLKKIEQDYQKSKLPFNPKGSKQAYPLLFVENIPVMAAADRASCTPVSENHYSYVNHYSFDFHSVLRKPPGFVFV